MMKQNDGGGIGLEVGRVISSSPLSARIYLKYHKWSGDDSETAFDGVQTLVEPENNTETITLGIGVML